MSGESPKLHQIHSNTTRIINMLVYLSEKIDQLDQKVKEIETKIEQSNSVDSLSMNNKPSNNSVTF